MINLTLKMIRPTKFKQCYRLMCTQAYAQQALPKSYTITNLEQEWAQAKEFSDIPGPSKFKFLSLYFPGGKLYKSNWIDLHNVLRTEYGDIFVLKRTMGKPNIVFTYNPIDIEKVYRTEGIWPVRIGIESFIFYREMIRPDIFKGIGGLLSEQGKAWADIRNKVNPILMKIQTVRQNLPQVDAVSSEFMEKLESIRDPDTNELTNFYSEVKLWALEAICIIGLNKRMGLVNKSNNVNPEAIQLAECMATFFQLSFEFDVQPSVWKYYKSRKFKKLIQTYEKITEITTKYIDEAVSKFEKDNEAPKGVLEKLCHVDKQIATVMVIDMLMAGIDTTSSVFLNTLYMVAKHQKKQDILRKEIIDILPDKNCPLTIENTKNMPYLRACIKESLRITPITPANFRMTTCDIVLSNYRVPKGTEISMGIMPLANDDLYFPQSSEFMPERWLKTGEDACLHAKSNNPFVYLPFGFGPRTCIGKRIAQMEIETLLARLIRNYKVSWYGNDMTYTSNIILVPSGKMRFKFEPLS